VAELSDDWLDIEPTPTARDLVKQDPQFAALVEHTKTLTPQQRNFLVCYSASHYDPVLACKRYAETFKRKISPRKLAAWLRDDPNFGRAISMREEIAARAAGVSVANVLDCLADIRRRNLGKDDRTAMIALEMIGKHLKMFKAVEDERQPGVTVPTGPGLSITFIHNAGAPQTVRVGNVVDAEVISVPTPQGDTNASK
jgi:hypothetical protein